MWHFKNSVWNFVTFMILYKCKLTFIILWMCVNLSNFMNPCEFLHILWFCVNMYTSCDSVKICAHILWFCMNLCTSCDSLWIYATFLWYMCKFTSHFVILCEFVPHFVILCELLQGSWTLHSHRSHMIMTQWRSRCRLIYSSFSHACVMEAYIERLILLFPLFHQHNFYPVYKNS